MLILSIVAVAMLLVPLTGGRLSRLGELRPRFQRLVLGALFLQAVVISVVPHWPRPFLVGVHIGSYALAAVFLWANRRLPGIKLIALGGGLNAAAIMANGGTMPADPGALAQAGITQEAGEFVNSGHVVDAKLAFLGDVFASPHWLPFHNVFSVGDALILAGAIYAVHRTCRGPRHVPAHARPSALRRLVLRTG